MSVWLPMASVDFFRRRVSVDAEDRRAILLSTEDRQRQIVAACCERAETAGVRTGMPIGEARALFKSGSDSHVRIEPHDPGRDRSALKALAVWAHRWSPLVAVDGPDGLLIDVTGCAPVWRGEERLLNAVRDDLSRLGLRSSTVIAPTFGCAWASARYVSSGRRIVAEGHTRAALSPLPVAALGVDEVLVSRLLELGIERIGQLLDLPRSALPIRFGESLLVRIDRALGQAIETIDPIRPLPPPRFRRAFDGPTDRIEAIECAVRDLLDDLVSELLSRESGVQTLDVVLVRSDLGPERMTLRLARPSRDFKHLWALIRPRLEKSHLGYGVEAVEVIARSTGLLQHEQIEYWTEEEALSRRFSTTTCARAEVELIDTLSNRLGRDRVLRADPVPSHLPERAVVWSPSTDTSRDRAASRGHGDQGNDLSVSSLVTPSDRPTVLFDRPFLARVVSLLPDGPVHRVEWRGEEDVVVHCRGPERLSPEWWRAGTDGVERDAFAVQTNRGQWLWLCRRSDTRSDAWTVDGMWA